MFNDIGFHEEAEFPSEVLISKSSGFPFKV